MPEAAVPQSAPTTLLEPRWPATLAVVGAIALYVTLPDSLVLGPSWVLPALEAAILIPLTLTRPHRNAGESGRSRTAAIMLIALANIGNVASLALLLHLLTSGSHIGGRTLLFAAIEIYLTNVIIFALWYWELDRGGPAARAAGTDPHPDFLFPQMSDTSGIYREWEPQFTDYAYVSFTNATAFSPTDTMPMSRWAKLAMMLQASVSLVTAALVIARAVNILK